ncbi:MAG TPA: hypothetical protein VHA07_12085 [Devosia sp.]|nr:hypothetical protein [Devosia sp.]
MRRKTKRTEELKINVQAELTDTLAEGVAAAMAAHEQMLAGEETAPADMADLFLEELNRLWAEEPSPSSAEATA